MDVFVVQTDDFSSSTFASGAEILQGIKVECDRCGKDASEVASHLGYVPLHLFSLPIGSQ